MKPSSEINTSGHYIPRPPQTQALCSTTFTPPTVDGSLTIPQLYDWHLENSPEHPVFIYSQHDDGLRQIFWPEVARAVHTGARIVRKIMGWHPGMLDIPVVAILAASETVSYFTMNMAIMRAGYISFPISPRNSASAIAHLIGKVGVKHVFLGRDQAMIDLAKNAIEILNIQHPCLPNPGFSPLPVFEDLYLDMQLELEDLPYEYKGPDQVAIYLHSSGSTSFPKPVPWTHSNCLENGLLPYFGERDLTGQIFSLHSIPMYHGMGVLHSFWAATCGVIISAFEPKCPAIIPTPQSHFEAAVACNSDFILSVPTIIEEWSRRPDYVEWLATKQGIIYGGGPLNKTVGDYLTSKGVSIFVLYGSTECGSMTTHLPMNVGYDWDYFRIPGNVTPEMVPYGNGVYELVLKRNPFFTPSVINTMVDGIEAYATSDLLEEHPKKPGYWRIYGRADDQIVHNTGEKTNPGPLESMLNQDPHVQASVMFGRGKFQVGVIIDPRPQFQFDPEDENKLAEFRNKIWPTVQKMNAFAPQHSRLFKEMVMVANSHKPFLLTAKNTVRRQATLFEYEDEINALYDAVANSTQATIPPPLLWDTASSLNFVRSVVNKVLSHSVKDDEDIFQHGCDSLQATWIRNTLLRALRDSAQVDTRSLSENFVYDHPNICCMASFLSALAAGSSGIRKTIIAKVNAMHAMVDKYTTNYPVHFYSKETELQGYGDVVLLTGSTGGLGCFLLASLVDNAFVSRVYAINRPSRSSVPLAERQANALTERGLNGQHILTSDKVKLLEADITVHGFGINDEIYEEMRRSVTHIIHNAWPVDFKMSLPSFDSSIQGVRSLIDFALTSPRPLPPTFVYTSSIGVFNNFESSQRKDAIPEVLIPAEVAVGMGYTESKWVAEDILMHASNHTKLNSVIVRVGQLSGGLNGSWNIAEWVPSLVQSSQVLGCLPTDERVVDWIPLNLAANALIDYRLAGKSSSSVIVHLIHPHPIKWSILAAVIASNLSISLVSYVEWLAELEGSTKIINGDRNHADVEAMRNIPALRLLSFFRSITKKIDGSLNAFGSPSLSCEMAVRLSPTLARDDLPRLGDKDISAWMGYWRRVGNIKDY